MRGSGYEALPHASKETNMMNFTRLALLGCIASLAGSSSAALFWTQPYDGVSDSAISTEFQDALHHSIYAFDDISLISPKNVVLAIAYGDPNLSQGTAHAVYAAIAPVPDISQATIVATGTQVGSDLHFTNFSLPAGKYWITFFTVQDYFNLDVWYIRRTGPNLTNNSEHYYHDPGGFAGFGQVPFPASLAHGTARQLSFQMWD